MYVDRHDWRRRRQFPEGQPGRWLGEFPRRSANADTDAGVDGVRIALAILTVLAVAGCAGIPQDGRYQNGDNFRAAAPELSAVRST